MLQKIIAYKKSTMRLNIIRYRTVSILQIYALSKYRNFLRVFLLFEIRKIFDLIEILVVNQHVLKSRFVCNVMR
jgi:hypothetical protein